MFGSAPNLALGADEKQNVELSQAAESSEMRVAIKGGVSTFLHSQSYRPAHFIKPSTRVEWAISLDARREVGLEIVGSRSDNENYSLMGALVFARNALYVGSVYDLNLRWGFGLGSGPKILFRDLSYEKAVVPWGQMGIDMSWVILPGVRVGTALTNENLSVLNLLLTLSFKI
jgi:hypothetical protein